MPSSHDVDGVFPLRDEIEDFAGKQRRFLITCYSTPVGYTVRAEEEGTDGCGYEFRSYSETTPSAALGRVREKMRRALATRHITAGPGGYEMTHDMVRGRITWDSEQDVGLVVDGILLNLEQFGSILGSHEGWGFELRLVDPLE